MFSKLLKKYEDFNIKFFMSRVNKANKVFLGTAIPKHGIYTVIYFVDDDYNYICVSLNKFNHYIHTRKFIFMPWKKMYYIYVPVRIDWVLVTYYSPNFLILDKAIQRMATDEETAEIIFNGFIKSIKH